MGKLQDKGKLGMFHVSVVINVDAIIVIVAPPIVVVCTW